MTKKELIGRLNSRQLEYDLSKVADSFTVDEKLTIICHKTDALGREHGEFNTTATKFGTRHDGCPKCSGRYMDRELFIAEANLVHGGKYNYDKFVFVNKRTKGIIYCPKHDVTFMQTPKKHLSGQGCPKCRYEKSAASNTHSTRRFIAAAKSRWGEEYDYSETVYVKNSENVKIICHHKDKEGREHGVFWMTPSNHLNNTCKQGCPKCGREKAYDKLRSTTEEFVEKAKQVHGETYDYSEVDYINNKTPVNIICRDHGVFSQEPSNHLIGQGCPHCNPNYSYGEISVGEYVESIGCNIKRNDRDALAGMELDIFVPSKRVAIEFDGLYWHNEVNKPDKDYHIKKTIQCENIGIRLIHIFEDEWTEKTDIVKSRIKNIMGLTDDRLYARMCEIRTVSKEEAKTFLTQNHIQGNANSTIRYGLYRNEELVSVMTFCKPRKNLGQSKKDGEYELLRFCNKLNTIIVGGASKLFTHFIREHNPSKVITYADRRWNTGNVYEKMGFQFSHYSRPNYFYVIKDKRYNRFNFRKDVLVRQGFDRDKSEHEIMLGRKIYRIYDCGTLVYNWQPHNQI